MLDKATFIHAYQAKARENLREANTAAGGGLQRAAISRAYYALYQAANAWLVHQTPDRAFDPERPNLQHQDVEARWPGILEQLVERHAIEVDFDGDRIYGGLKNLRVWVDYKPRSGPSVKDASAAVEDARRAVGWLLAALKKAGR